MVFFTCEGCGDSVKKQQAEKHKLTCRRYSGFCCVDCHQVFYGDDFVSHTKCISELEKYSAKGFVAKEAKGEAKQQAWFDQVQRAIESTQPDCKQLRNLLSSLTNHPNIPRKEAKFKNFLANSLRVRDPKLCAAAWKAITAADVSKEQAIAAPIPLNASNASTNGVKNGAASTNSSRQNGCGNHDGAVVADRKRAAAEPQSELIDDEGPVKKCKLTDGSEPVADNNNDESTAIDRSCDVKRKFNWRSSIKRFLKAQPSQSVKLKRLRSSVLREFRTWDGTVFDEEEVRGKFERKLRSCFHVTVNGKIVTYTSSETSVSSLQTIAYDC